MKRSRIFGKQRKYNNAVRSTEFALRYGSIEEVSKAMVKEVELKKKLDKLKERKNKNGNKR